MLIFGMKIPRSNIFQFKKSEKETFKVHLQFLPFLARKINIFQSMNFLAKSHVKFSLESYVFFFKKMEFEFPNINQNLPKSLGSRKSKHQKMIKNVC